MKKKILKQTKGITLIALVITIIVLLILAAVSIATLTGNNGLLTKAIDAKNKTKEAEIREQIELEVLASLDTDGTLKADTIIDNLKSHFGLNDSDITKGENEGFPITVTVDGYTFEIDNEGKVKESKQGPTVSHKITPEDGTNNEKVTITLTVTPVDGTTVKSITKPDGVTETGDKTYEVTANGTYTFKVEGSDGGITTYNVEITNAKDVEKFSDKYEKTTEITSADGKRVWVPAGFAVGTTNLVNNVSKGLVITDSIKADHTSDGNEFVWIPVDSAESYVRDFSYPSYYDSNLDNTPDGSTFTDTGYLPSNLQPATDSAAENEQAEREAVTSKYKGFYISRYEAGDGSATSSRGSSSGTSGSIVSKKNAVVYNYIKQTDAKAKAKTMYNNSALCSGIQWDMVMKFVNGKTDGKDETFDVKIYNLKRHLGSVKNTGTNDSDKVQNIYDLEGNTFEWVAEKNTTGGPFVLRGGFCNSISFLRASLRSSSNVVSYDHRSFRVALYVMQD